MKSEGLSSGRSSMKGAGYRLKDEIIHQFSSIYLVMDTDNCLSCSLLCKSLPQGAPLVDQESGQKNMEFMRTYIRNDTKSGDILVNRNALFEPTSDNRDEIGKKDTMQFDSDTECCFLFTIQGDPLPSF